MRRRWALSLTWLAVSVLCAGAVAGVAVADARAGPIAGIEVTMSFPDEGVVRGGTFAVTFELRNIGSERYADVAVEGRDACGAVEPPPPEFEEGTGDGDAVFEPGEAWHYRIPACTDWAVQFASVEIWATPSVGERMSGVYTQEYVPRSPIAVRNVGDVSVVCGTDRLAVEITNSTRSSLLVERAALSVASGVLEFEMIRASNHDVFLDPTETWELVFPVELPCNSLGPSPPVPVDLAIVGWNSIDPTSTDSWPGEVGAPWCFGRAEPLVTCQYGEQEARIGSIVVVPVAYVLVESDGQLYGFGEPIERWAPNAGLVSVGGAPVAAEVTADGTGAWVLGADGTVRTVGSAQHFGDLATGALESGELPSALSATPDGDGYWVFTNRGRAVTFGSAEFFGDMVRVPLNGPVVASTTTPSGQGYYMVATDGGVFAFGDARFHGSMGGTVLNQPVNGIAPDPDGGGYWLVASDGGVFAFDADFLGSMGSVPLNAPVVGAVSFGDGYLLVGADGGIFNFSSLPFIGSLGADPPDTPVRSVAAYTPPSP